MTSERHIEYIPLATVKRAKRNPKLHDRESIRASLNRFGLGELPLIDERTGLLVAGEGRINELEALHTANPDTPPDGLRVNQHGEWLVPVIAGWASHDDTEADAYLVASNHLSERGGWDGIGLAEMLTDLNGALDGLGYSETELDELLRTTGYLVDGDIPPFDLDSTAELADDSVGPLDPPHESEPSSPQPLPKTTKKGDVWIIGKHRVMCGDCRNQRDIDTLVGAAQPMLVFTSPPYAAQRSYDEDSGFTPIKPIDYVKWFADVQSNILRVLHTNGSLFINIKEHCENGQRDLYVYDLVIAHVREWGWLWVDELCWFDTRNGLPGVWNARFKDAWERIYHLSRSKEITFNPLANGYQTNRTRQYSPETHFGLRPDGYAGPDKYVETEGIARPSNVIQIASGAERGFSHSAAFPPALPAWFIRAYSNPGDTVFDPFSGSGTTVAAAHSEGRTALGMELSPQYVDLTCRRLQLLTRIKPIRESTGEPHDFVAEDNSRS